MAIDKILVSIDFSLESLKSYELAVAQFGGLGKALILLHVIDSISTDVENDPKLGIRFVDERERKLKNIVGDGANWRSAEIVIVSGKPADQIVKIAAEKAVDLLVMGAHGGGSGIVEGLFGKTTYSVARKVRCAVLISK